ncbi:MAG: TonB-dependent receptor plug domain-containing protein, partial [Elusimicrobia bacterium]|nr:TonB-dependent receptor plug domain-containing protein [Elusimicrobiota bacterium]
KVFAVSCVLLVSSCMSAVFGFEEVKFDSGTAFITLTRKPELQKNLSTNVSLVSQNKIRETNAITIGDLLKDSVGITEVSKTGTLGSTSNIRIRSGGDTSKQVLVMIDGLRMNNLATGAANLSLLPADNIERIEIVRGPSSSLYGSSALNGVVNIINKKPKGKELGLTLQSESYNTNVLKATYGDKNDIFSWLLSGSINRSDGWRENSDANSSHLNTNIGIDLKTSGKIKINLDYFSEESGIPGSNYTKLSVYDNMKERTATTPNARENDNNNYLQIGHEIPITENFNLNSKIFYRKTNMEYKDTDNFTFDNNTTDNAGVTLQLNAPKEIVIGADVQNQTYKKFNQLTEQEDIAKTFTINSFFIQKDFAFFPLRTTIGLRYDGHSVYGDQINPRLNSIYVLDPYTKFSLNIGRAFVGPTFEDLYSPKRTWDYFGYGGETKGNPTLVPEISCGYDVGMENILNENTTSRITLFRSDIQDKIEWVDNNVPTAGYVKYDLWKPENIGEAYNQGVEYEIDSNSSILPVIDYFSVPKDFSNQLNFTYVDSKGRNNSSEQFKTLQYTPQYRTNYSLTYENSFSLKQTISIEYTSEQKWIDDDAAEHKLSARLLFNYKITYNFDYTELFAAINNLSDVKYQSRENYPLPGIVFKAGITFRY